jgi:hypothetical protein
MNNKCVVLLSLFYLIVVSTNNFPFVVLLSLDAASSLSSPVVFNCCLYCLMNTLQIVGYSGLVFNSGFDGNCRLYLIDDVSCDSVSVAVDHPTADNRHTIAA